MWIALALAIFATACPMSEVAPPEHPVVILISLDTLRPDHLGVYGYERPTSPNLDAFAETALIFEHKRDPRVPEYYANRASAYVSLGRKEDAILDFERSLEVAPADWKFRKRVERILGQWK